MVDIDCRTASVAIQPEGCSGSDCIMICNVIDYYLIQEDLNDNLNNSITFYKPGKCRILYTISFKFLYLDISYKFHKPSKCKIVYSI